ncbi:LAQU0S05e03840g1_1 [Lachancea quebecensis]|uniref:LAQU0S05e03840g1_1 n=1 Tax=Lachancea quebecensis TaxID=1654605 RepID=A0A0P1KQJ6_9SACH|nr:LAQU0S05e03840g1_1 [Lachancea quebecensis]
MDRVRNLVRRSNGPRTSRETNVSVLRDPVASDSDQATLVESRRSDEQRSHNDEGPGRQRRNSETSTIGDYRVSGFVNRCPLFQGLRHIVFASTVMGKGFYAFPSIESFQQFRKNKRRLDELHDEQALGFPLFHAIPVNVFRTIIKRSLPMMKIHRYVLVDTSIPGEAEKYQENETCTLMAQLGTLSVYKLEFCQVFQRIHTNTSFVEYKFTFRIDNQPENNLFSMKMVNHIHRRDTDSRINDLNLRWLGTSGLASPFGSGTFQLAVLDDGIASFLDELPGGSHEQPRRPAQQSRSPWQMPVWATYSDGKSTFIPKKRTLRIADFKIKELTECCQGLQDVPWDTLVLTCMCMVLHDLEARKDRRSMNISAGGELALAGAFM